MKALLIFVLAAALSACAVTGEPIRYKAGSDAINLNVNVDGSAMTATVLADRHPIITHSWPPFVNSRDEKSCRYRDHDIRSVLKVIKGIGNTTAQVYVWVDGERAGEWFF